MTPRPRLLTLFGDAVLELKKAKRDDVEREIARGL